MPIKNNTRFIFKYVIGVKPSFFKNLDFLPFVKETLEKITKARTAAMSAKSIKDHEKAEKVILQ